MCFFGVFFKKTGQSVKEKASTINSTKICNIYSTAENKSDANPESILKYHTKDTSKAVPVLPHTIGDNS